MRIGLLADIHGNLVALEAVLDDLAGERVDRLVCLGDVAALGPQPGAVVARLRALGCSSALGNTDAWLLDAPPAEPDDAAMARWCRERLAAADLAYLRACPATFAVQLAADATLLCFHGSPRSYDDVLAATTPAEEVERLLGGHAAAVYAGGHTHLQLLRRHDEARLINPGSVGLPGVGPGAPDLPVNRRVRWAEYALLEADAGRLRVDLRRVPLDLGRVRAAARARDMPGFTWWDGLWDAS